MNRKMILAPLIILLMLLSVPSLMTSEAKVWTEKNNDKFQTFYSAGKINAGTAIGSAERIYVPSFDNVEKMISIWSESFISFEIKVGEKTYKLHTDFEASGSSEHIYWDPVFGASDINKVFPVASRASHTGGKYTFDFLQASGLEGSFSIQTIVNEGNHRTTSLSGTGDFRNVQIQATVSQIQARPFLTILNDGLVIGWPE
jgi:hypothetical protein